MRKGWFVFVFVCHFVLFFVLFLAVILLSEDTKVF